jgi:Uma2 family endonuclease
MTVAPSTAAPVAPAGLDPLLLPWTLRLTPEQFELVCQANPDAVLELAADGQLIAMSPTSSETGAFNSALVALLWMAVRRSGLPLPLFDSSTGFRLPDGSVLSPDASLVRLDRWKALTPEQRRTFAPLCPDLVVELASPSVAAGFSEGVEGPRGVSALRQKMATYRANGAQLGWLLLPDQQAVEIWRVDQAEPERIEPATELDGGMQFPGLVIDLAEVWAA